MANTNIFDMLDTWNNVATTFDAIKMNVTDTASASASKLINLQVGGVNYLSLTKGGLLDLHSTTGQIRSVTYTIFSGGSLNFNASDANAPVLRYDAAGVLAQRTSAVAQTYRLYNTYTSATDYERLSIGWASNLCTIKAEAQTGTVRPLQVKFTPQTVATLPAAGTAGAGARMFVSDASAPTFGSTVTGGGAVNVPVYSDGAAWIVG